MATSIKSNNGHDMMNKLNKKIILKGIATSHGVVKGKAKIILQPDQMDKMDDENILVAPHTSLDYTPAISKASVIVTDIGGMLSHAAIVSRESGILCVAGTGNAAKNIVWDFVPTISKEVFSL